MLATTLPTLPACRPVDRSASNPGQRGNADDGNSSPASGPLETVTTAGGIEMVRIPAGTFVMGSDDGRPDEAPAHEVRVDAFWTDRYEVTQAHWDKIVRGNPYLKPSPSHFKGPDRPVEMIGWDQAALFCNARSRAEGLQPCYDEQTGACNFEADGYRLPTEAEWEYACRAGSESLYSFGDDAGRLDEHAWFAANAAKTTHPVGGKKPNPWGLFDMHGNVAEWCQDVYGKDYYATSPGDNPRGPAEDDTADQRRVLRGGAWNSKPDGCRSAYRIGEDPGFSDACFARDAIGFRCVRRGVAEEPQQPPTEPRGSPVSYFDVDTPVAFDDLGALVMDETRETKAAGHEAPRGKTGLVYDDLFLKHDTGVGHPERPERLEEIMKRLRSSGLAGELVMLQPKPIDEKWLATVHSLEYVRGVKESCRSGAHFVDSPDAPVSKDSYDAALLAAGGVLIAVDAVMEGKVRNAFCAVRPPGHHARKSQAMGFCLFNNVAVTARYLRQQHKLARVLIVDWDVHHGNGTQETFYDDPSVFYFSIHQWPFYPGSGTASQQGAGKGRGSILNVPLPPGSGNEAYRDAFEKQLRPAAMRFRPDFVLVSAGFDAHEHDLLGGMKVTAQGFAELTQIVRDIADECCGGRLVAVLEGGYGLEGLAESVEAHLRVLMK